MNFVYICLMICLLGSVNVTIATLSDEDRLWQTRESRAEEKRAVPVVGLAIAGINAALALGARLLGKTGSSERHYENEVMICYRKDQAARDARARIERTYDNCRFQHDKKAWIFFKRTWYCLMKQDACKTLGHALD
ncbi:uncharacterized protein LOC141912273 [Tubulanus polymorphus]|uniref:uncharacterized protein LOC141912273 n=1 Tax=Tubulanus polymorphus TaxID=672921 RepID=UPI003DA692BC